MECQMLRKSMLLLNFLLVFLSTPASGTGTAGMNGPIQIVKTLENREEKELKVRKIQFYNNIYADGQPETRVCPAERVGDKTHKTVVVVSVDLANCDPALEKPIDLGGMKLRIEYSFNGWLWQDYVFNVPWVAELWHALFDGGVQFRIPPSRAQIQNWMDFVKDIEPEASGSSASHSHMDVKKQHPSDVARNGPTQIVIEHPNGHCKVHTAKFTGGGRHCPAAQVPDQPAPNSLTIALDLAGCNPPLEDPKDLAGMTLAVEYSVGHSTDTKPESISLPSAAYEKFLKALFVGGVRFRVPTKVAPFKGKVVPIEYYLGLLAKI